MGIGDWLKGRNKGGDIEPKFGSSVKKGLSLGEELQRDISRMAEEGIQARTELPEEYKKTQLEKALAKQKQEIEREAEDVLRIISSFPRDYENIDTVRKTANFAEREDVIDAILSYVQGDILQVSSLLLSFHLKSDGVSKFTKGYGEIPQDFLDDIEAKRQALLLAQENKIRELESLAQKYEEEKANLK